MFYNYRDLITFSKFSSERQEDREHQSYKECPLGRHLTGAYGHQGKHDKWSNHISVVTTFPGALTTPFAIGQEGSALVYM